MKKYILILVNFLLLFSIVSATEYNEPIFMIHEIYTDDMTNMTEEEKKIIKEKYDKKFDLIRGITYKNTNEFNEIEIMSKNITEYLKNKYSSKANSNYNSITENLQNYFNKLIIGNPERKMEQGDFEIIILDYEEPVAPTVKIKEDETSEFYKDLYFIKMVWTQHSDKKYEATTIEVYKKIRDNTKKWNSFFNNVREPQYPWEEIANSLISNKVYDPEEYIKKSPNGLQLTLVHFTPTVEYNFDESSTLTPALGIQLIGLRNFHGEFLEKNYGISYIMTLNSDSEDNKPGNGIMFNYNKYDIGVIYRNSSRADTKWWLVFGFNVAGFIPNTEVPSEFKVLEDSK